MGNAVGYSGSSGGGGSGGRRLSRDPLTMVGAVNNYMGRYHNLLPNGTQNPPYISQLTATFDWAAFPMGNNYDSNDYATNPFEPLANSRSEVPCCLTVAFYPVSGDTITHKWYRDSDGVKVFEASYVVPPLSGGDTYWNWTWFASWIGKFPNEMKEPGNYHVVVSGSLSNQRIDFTFTGGVAGDIVVSDISVTPSYVNIGDRVTIHANIRNDGDFTSTQNVSLKSGYNILGSMSETLAPHDVSYVEWFKVAGVDSGFEVGSHNICVETNVDDAKCANLTVNAPIVCDIPTCVLTIR